MSPNAVAHRPTRVMSPLDLRVHREIRAAGRRGEAMKTGRHEAWREYASGALWVLPGASMVAALVLGALLSTVRLSTDTPLRHLLFQGTEDDARTLLIGVVG